MYIKIHRFIKFTYLIDLVPPSPNNKLPKYNIGNGIIFNKSRKIINKYNIILILI